MTTLHERNARLLADYARSGVSMAALGRKYGITGARVCQIIQGYAKPRPTSAADRPLPGRLPIGWDPATDRTTKVPFVDRAFSASEVNVARRMFGVGAIARHIADRLSELNHLGTRRHAHEVEALIKALGLTRRR